MSKTDENYDKLRIANANKPDGNVLCIHDNGDNDGMFSAAVIKAAFPDAVMKGWRYDEPYSLLELEEEYGTFDTIIVCDLPLLQPIKEWNKLQPAQFDKNEDNLLVTIMGKHILWFDHHASNMKDMKNLRMWPVAGLQSQDNCAAFNAYKYLNDIDMVADDVQVIKYVDTYDCWRKEGGLVKWEKALDFNFGMKVFFENEDIDSLVEAFINNEDEEDIIDEVLTNGKAIRLYIESKVEWLKSSIEIAEFEDIEIKFINVTSEKSYLGDLLNDDDGVIALWSHTGDKYLYSLRTKRTDIDLSEIARKYGGGGHKQAAGFSADTLIHKLWPVIKQHR